MSSLLHLSPFSSQWDAAVLNSGSPQFFHLSCWIKTLIDTYKFKPLCFMLQGSSGSTIPFLIVKSLTGKKRAVALPFSDGCDIQCAGMSHDELVKMLLDIAKDEKLDRLELKGVSKFSPSGEKSHHYFGHRLQLSKDENLLWKKLSSSKGRNIRKAQRENIQVTFNSDLESVREYYRLHCITRKRHGLPPQPRKFFDTIYQNIIAKGAAEVALAKIENRWISGAVYFFCGTEVLYKFGGSDKSVQNMRSNDLLMWEAIKRYAQKGYKVLSFGKTESYHEGLCRFKEGFGAERIDLYDHIYDVATGRKKTVSPSVHGLHNLVFQKMPLPLLRLSGRILYKYSA